MLKNPQAHGQQGADADAPDGRLKVKVTLTSDQTPELYRELSRIPSGPKRAGRLLTLAMLGEYAIRTGQAVVLQQRASAERPTTLQPRPSRSAAISGGSLSSTSSIKDTLSWGQNDE